MRELVREMLELLQQPACAACGGHRSRARRSAGVATARSRACHARRCIRCPGAAPTRTRAWCGACAGAHLPPAGLRRRGALRRRGRALDPPLQVPRRAGWRGSTPRRSRSCTSSRARRRAARPGRPRNCWCPSRCTRSGCAGGASTRRRCSPAGWPARLSRPCDPRALQRLRDTPPDGAQTGRRAQSPPPQRAWTRSAPAARCARVRVWLVDDVVLTTGQHAQGSGGELRGAAAGAGAPRGRRALHAARTRVRAGSV